MKSLAIGRLVLCGGFALSALVAAPAVALEYGTVQLGKSSIRFVARQMGVPTDGHFSRFGAQLAFDPAKPESGRARIEVDLASIDVGGAEANEEVKSKSWFNIKETPAATFVSSQLRALGSGRYEAVGRMSIKGRTQEIVAPFTAKQEGANMVLDGSIPIRRLQYGIGEGMWSDVSVVADEVQVNFRFVLSPSAGSKK
ncbi:conserved exported protein of unknown function [Sterolibacterium denitrificans]|uniref:Uncharacterized protein n=2 Tax=Sterolibacterium denitrificans TaxID=157592 RepID=A0A7Z7HNR5_9PROT|nr:YceI family protein [Sterolibacterium denitrificans]KYC28837.1 polyisoprenoid-binding protein [Sterolibacterium denitrificans]SMB21181.1 conserved exported protein of unknown function [Sterolibacterium denitrificans]